jgi:signal transduction histidine kinase
MEFTPTVNEAAEFLEISNDFTNPKEVIREAISNCFDAGAKNIKVEIYVDRSRGMDELIINIEDDGEGMSEKQLKAFFSLGYTTRVAVDERGFKVSPSIGEKGHGTKVYFNSRRIEVKTWKNNQYLEAYMDSPRQTLRREKLPKVIYESKEW